MWTILLYRICMALFLILRELEKMNGASQRVADKLLAERLRLLEEDIK